MYKQSVRRALHLGRALLRRDGVAAARLLEQRVYFGQHVDRAGRNADHFYAVISVQIGFVGVDPDHAGLATGKGVRKLIT